LPVASRAPASVPSSAPQRLDEGHKLATKDDALFQDKEAPLPPSGPLAGDGPGLRNSGISAQTPRQNGRVARAYETPTPDTRTHDKAPVPTKTASKNPTFLVVTPPKVKPTETTNSPPVPSASAPTQDISCTAGTGGGTFNRPQNISLSCTSAATVRYCLAENVCCDPDNGVTYMGPIAVGSQATTYCLSFYGESSGGARSTEVQVSYTFAADVPHLLVSHPKVRYQTTELLGKAIVTSNDFGSEPFELRQINLQTHDPSPAGLNLDCDEIAAAPATLSAPTPTTILGPLDIQALTSGSQLENILGTTKLVYGDNYITTLITNSHFTPALRSCSTTQVILWDFEFFHSEPIHAEAGSDTVREFEGGFTSLGFFEETATVYREPAGVSVKATDAQELRTGLFGVFY
jgi:hypothetical protein